MSSTGGGDISNSVNKTYHVGSLHFPGHGCYCHGNNILLALLAAIIVTCMGQSYLLGKQSCVPHYPSEGLRKLFYFPSTYSEEDWIN